MGSTEFATLKQPPEVAEGALACAYFATHLTGGGPQGLFIRRAGISDSRQIAALFEREYRNSSHPFRSVADVANFLADSRNFQVVAEAGNNIVSSMAMTYSAWNDSYELGRAITHPDFRRSGLASILMQRVVDWVCESALGQVIFGFPRVRRIVDLCSALHPPMIVAGHDAARNVANGSRETHLITYAVRHANFVHVAPPASLAASWFVRERIYRPLGLHPSPGEYPPWLLAGAPSADSTSFEGLVFEYDRRSPNQALEILGHSFGFKQAGGFGRVVDRLLKRAPGLRHATATVLADKIDAICELCDLGFEIAAYLPAWYKLGRRRYDCVQLARRFYKERPAANSFEDIVLTLEDGLSSLGSPSRVRMAAS